MQIIVVDGASTDGTADIVRHYAERDPRVELLHNPRAIVPISLNLAARAARGRWFVRIDAHATVPPDYVSTAVGHLFAGTKVKAGDTLGLVINGVVLPTTAGTYGLKVSTSSDTTTVSVASGLSVVPEPTVAVGARVRILSGPLTGIEGKVIRRGKRDQFIAVVHFLGSGATVDLEDWQVEQLPEDGEDGTVAGGWGDGG